MDFNENQTVQGPKDSFYFPNFFSTEERKTWKDIFFKVNYSFNLLGDCGAPKRVQ